MMRSIIFFTTLFSGLITYGQQGRNFSMWFQNHMQYNPAAVGTNDNDMQAFANFRYQYFTVTDKPYQTVSGSVEGKLFRSNTRNGYLGLGGSFLNDMSGDGRYSVTQVSVPIAYHLFFNADNFISVGLQPGLYQRSLSGGNLTWDHQWNGYEFNNTVPGEGIGNASSANLDLSAGIFYTYKKDYTRKIYGGVSMQHITQPELTFNIEDNLYRRYTAHAGANYKFELSTFGISPQVMFMKQGPNQNLVFGSNFDFYLVEPSLRTDFYRPHIFSFGVYHRLGDAIIANFSYTFSGWTIAASYDSNINRLMPASSTIGGFEVAVKYDIILNRAGKFIR
ncbi:MAG: PorP/SprF family type IX secretion system membrane protein [Brumimicrobium sp.]|nr:PorP/SprF family type IX secretion system membrane protein [Brumimicrobium sp.]